MSAVARVVQRIDNAATLRAFIALVVPALVVWHLVSVGMVLDFGLVVFDDGEEQTKLLAFGVFATLIAIWPLSFILADWMDRQDRLHLLSGITAAVLALGGASLFALGAGIGLRLALDDADGHARIVAASLLAVVVVAAVGWMLGRSRTTRNCFRVLAGALILATAGLIVALAKTDASDEVEHVTLAQMIFYVAVLLVLAIWWVRAIGLRMVLAENHPRALLFGALPPGRFWVRIAALLGLPASTWSAGALREPAAWAFLLARPVVLRRISAP